MASLKDRLAQNLQRNQSAHEASPTRPPAGLAPPGEERPQVTLVPTARVAPNPFQPRREFDEEALAALAHSVEREGLLQPIAVRPNGAQGYQLISGERRLRAFRLLGRAEVPALIIPMSDAESAAAALQENIKREDLSDFEVSEGLRALREVKERAGERVTLSALAEALAVSRPALYRYLSFEALPAPARALLSARPRLLSGTAARELELWARGVEERGGALEGYADVLCALLEDVARGALTQGGLVEQVAARLPVGGAAEEDEGEAEEGAGRAEAAERAAERAGEPAEGEEPQGPVTLRRGDIRFGSWETREQQIKISLNRSSLTIAQEEKLRSFLERLLKLDD